MAKSPLELNIEELDAAYGEPVKIATVTHVLSMMANTQHDLVTFELITEDKRRMLVSFTQSALREFVDAGSQQARAADKPKRN